MLFFDTRSEGHHPEYSGRLINALSDIGINAEILTLKSNEKLLNIVDRDCIIYPQTKTLKNQIKEFYSVGSTHNFDILHFLHLDNILMEVDAVKGSQIPTLATINGSFFNHYLINKLFREFMKTGGGNLLSHIPKNLGFGTLLKEMYLKRAFFEGKLNKILVHSMEAMDYLEPVFTDATHSTRVVPDPIHVEHLGKSKQELRTELDLPLQGVQLLFFGELRRNKGIQFLLESLKEYTGPKISLVIAGKPIDIERGLLDNLCEDASIPVQRRFHYIPSAEVPKYFGAVDGVILPYKSEFGECRTSGVFQKACGYLRPVIAPDFGFLGRQTEEKSLGLTFKTGSSSHLRQTIREFAYDPQGSFDSGNMNSYAKSQTYDELADILSAVYHESLNCSKDDN